MTLTAIFPSGIRTQADRHILAKCSCRGDACHCTDFLTNEPFHITYSNQNFPMSILEKMAAVGIKLEDLAAAAPSLPQADVRALIAALSDGVKSSDRMERLQASNDRETNLRVQFVSAELTRLGIEKRLSSLNAAARKYSVHELDKQMKDAGWQVNRKMALKADLARLGLLD
jgi:hypothetical protein